MDKKILMNKKILILVIVIAVALTPWVYINNKYGGLINIPPDDINIWTFMVAYLTLFTIIFFVIAYFLKESTEDYIVPRRSQPPIRTSLKKNEKSENKKSTKEKTSKNKEPEKIETKTKLNENKESNKTTEQDDERAEWADLYKEARK